jgi:hypothetical protein
MRIGLKAPFPRIKESNLFIISSKSCLTPNMAVLSPTFHLVNRARYQASDPAIIFRAVRQQF